MKRRQKRKFSSWTIVASVKECKRLKPPLLSKRSDMTKTLLVVV
jgi:hypothetical protein